MSKRKHDDDDHEKPPRYPSMPEAVKRGPFTYDGLMSEIVVKGQSKGDPNMWRNTLFPTPDTQTARLIRHAVLTKTYVRAQFEHFGIPYEPGMTKAQLRMLFYLSLREGKFDTVPPSILALQASIREEYDRRYAEYEAALKVYEGQRAKRRATEYSRATTLSEKANIDGELFIREFYLDTAGAPDRTKQPGMIRLDGMKDGNRVRFQASKVDGMAQDEFYWEKREGEWGKVGTIFLGWDEDQIKAARDELVARVKLQEAAEKAEREQQRYNQHLQYISEAATVAASGAKAATKPSALGRYLVRCPTIETGWNIEDGLYLTIRPLNLFYEDIRRPKVEVLEGVFDFDVIQGVFLFCTDHEALVDFWHYRMGMQITRPGRQQENSGPSKDGANPALSMAAKEDTPLLYHFIWAGIEGGTGEICADFEDELYGTLLFEDGFAKFGGEMDVVIEGGMSFLGGGKVSDSLECDDEQVRHQWGNGSAFESYYSEFDGGFDPFDDLSDQETMGLGYGLEDWSEGTSEGTSEGSSHEENEEESEEESEEETDEETDEEASEASDGAEGE